MSKMFFFGRCGADNELTSTVVGATGSITGTVTYSGVKFGNGGNFGNGHCPVYSNWLPLANTSKFSMDFWIKDTLGYNSGNKVYIPCYYSSGGNAVYGTFIYNSASTLQIWIIHAVGDYTQYKFNVSYGANSIFHLAVFYDASLSNGNRIKAYIDGVALTVNSISNDKTWDFTGKANVLSSNYVDWTNTNFFYIDNIKFRADNDLIVLSQRFDERGGMNDQCMTG